MYDYHLHSSVSFDSEASAIGMALAAEKSGLKEICFTDHCDYHTDPYGKHYPIDLDKYSREYDGLSVKGLKIRRGVEFGTTRSFT